jgi:glycerol-3-phosphate dehydrogenase
MDFANAASKNDPHMKEFSAAHRNQDLDQLKTKTFDILVLGGGITGAGVARDAALRGFSVALIEQNDFASGTSSRSSKLIHGGLRYLENLDFKLVFEALSERRKLFSLAPHLVHPLRFLIPLFKKGRVGMFKMGLGMWLYDALSLFDAPEMHEKLSPEESLERIPILQSKDLLGSYEYSDAYMDDDRLVHETLRSANHFGAVCLNYAEAKKILFSKGMHAQGVVFVDKISGAEHTITAKHVISSIGPWTDLFAETRVPKWKKILRPTKGVHITFERERVNLSRAVVMAAEKRIVFAIPRHEMVIVGTTDTDFKGDPSDVVTSAQDIDYLLEVTNNYFPRAMIQKSDIIASYAGVRPLVDDGADTEGKTSREHMIFESDCGIIFVAGGKYTTYRLMAEQIVEMVVKKLPFEQRLQRQQTNSEKPLNPKATEEIMNMRSAFEEDLGFNTNLSLAEKLKLFDRFGAEAVDLVEKYPKEWNYFQLEAAHAILNTKCLTMLDFYTRRVPMILSMKDHGLSQFENVAKIFEQLLGWDHQRISEEKIALQKHLQRELSWKSNNASY